MFGFFLGFLLKTRFPNRGVLGKLRVSNFPLLRNSPVPLSSYPSDLLAPYLLPSFLPSAPGLSSVQCFSLIPIALFNQASYFVPWIDRLAIAIVSLAVFAAFRHRFSTSHSFHLTSLASSDGLNSV